MGVDATGMHGGLTVVTGASSGIGEATARALAGQGAEVVLMARRQDRLDSLADDIRAAGGIAHAVPVDLGQPAAVAKAAEHVLQEIGVPDVVVNNAGAGRFLFIDETPPEEAVQMMAAPYFAAFFVTRAFIEPMIARGSGRIVMVNTPGSLAPWPGASGYAAARFALRGLTEGLRQDLHGTGVTVCAVTLARVTSEYFESNPGAGDRIPRAEALVGHLTPEQAGAAVVRAVRTGRREVHAPWRWRVIAPFVKAFPAPLAFAFRVTGAKRPKR